jgi:hypothetical protein
MTNVKVKDEEIDGGQDQHESDMLAELKDEKM